VLVACVLYITLRSVVLLVISVLTLIVGLSATAAFAALAVGHLNLLSVAFAVLYIGLGVDFILHVCLRLKELTAEGMAVREALIETTRGVGSSLVICAATTAAGFYSFVPTPFSGVSELGLISGTGMLLSLLVSITLLPALLAQFYSNSGNEVSRPWLGARILGPLTRRPRMVLGIAVIVAIGTVVTLPRLSFDTNPVNLRDPTTESVTTLEELAADGEALPLNMVAIAPDRSTAASWAQELAALATVANTQTLESMVPADQQQKLAVLEDIDLLMGPGFADVSRVEPDPAEFRAALETLGVSLGQVGSPSAAALSSAIDGYLEPVPGQRPGGAPLSLAELEWNILRTLPGHLQRLAAGLQAQPFQRNGLPAALTDRWVTPDGRELVEIVPAGNVNDAQAAARLVESVRATVPGATGLPVIHQEAGRTVVQAFQLAFIYALAMVSIILWVFLRKLGDSVLVIVPIIFAAGVTAAIAVVTGLQFNFANIIALPLLLGVGVDNGIHMVHRVRAEPSTHRRVVETSTSRAVFASGLTTIASFGNLAFTAHLGMASMGKLLTLGMIVTLAATLILLPALLRLQADS